MRQERVPDADAVDAGARRWCSRATPAAFVTARADGARLMEVRELAPATGSGESPHRRLRWVGWITGRVLHTSCAPKFT